MSSLHRSLLILLPLVAVGCTKPIPWSQLLTPSGQPCPDMPIYPAGEKLDRDYHRLKPIRSKWKIEKEDKSVECNTGPERLESLRQVACDAKADAVIEAVEEEVRTKDLFCMRASGTAIVWKKGPALSPFTTGTTSGPTPTNVTSLSSGSGSSAPAPAPAPAILPNPTSAPPSPPPK